MANYVKFMRGTPAAYEALLNGPTKPSKDTLYFISEADSNNATLYLGEKIIAGNGSDLELSLSNITDIALSEDLADKDILAYDSASHKWVNITLDDIFSVFIGATSASSGIAGLVPAPAAGQTNLFLRSDGTWAAVDTQDRVNIRTIENEDSSVMHQDLIDAEVADLLLNSGDIVIVKDKIANDKWEYTSYVYNGSAWCAMDGKYNAESVYFDDDFTFTKAIGTVKIPESGSIKVSATGMNIRDFFASLFAQEEDPKITSPSASISCSNAGAYEVGEKVTPKYSVTFKSGSYSFGPETGVTANTYHVTDTRGVNKDTQSGTMNEITIVDGINYSISATVDYSDGMMPKTNIGNDFEEGRIKAGTTSTATSSKITGYRNLFVGPDTTGNAINSEFIRNSLSAKGDATKSYTITWAAADTPGIKRYIVAIPANSGRKVSHVSLVSAMGAPATGDYILQPNLVSVKGANDYTSETYKLWIYEPAEITEDQIHEITIS